jgi:hypothetical protein
MTGVNVLDASITIRADECIDAQKPSMPRLDDFMNKTWMKLFTIMDGSLFEVGACAGDSFARLDQFQFGCPVDSHTAIIDAKLAVDALCM